MKECFVIMQIGDPEMDMIWKEVFCTTITDAGFDPILISEKNDGTLLANQIHQYLKRSDLIVADLTNERPNCYFEVGYTMGLNRNDRLILCCREDHNPRIRVAKKYKTNKEIHFDLAGYGIILWDPDNLPKFTDDLKKEILRRTVNTITKTQQIPKSKTNEKTMKNWMQQEHKEALNLWKKK
ncbi:MAG: hypothetical protein HQM16_04405 [Deltaproteobacteria bacterium]|nr:hypothetical protein [Deltaproteobacteria bacterium]